MRSRQIKFMRFPWDPLGLWLALTPLLEVSLLVEVLTTFVPSTIWRAKRSQSAFQENSTHTPATCLVVGFWMIAKSSPPQETTLASSGMSKRVLSFTTSPTTPVTLWAFLWILSTKIPLSLVLAIQRPNFGIFVQVNVAKPLPDTKPTSTQFPSSLTETPSPPDLMTVAAVCLISAQIVNWLSILKSQSFAGRTILFVHMMFLTHNSSPLCSQNHIHRVLVVRQIFVCWLRRLQVPSLGHPQNRSSL